MKRFGTALLAIALTACGASPTQQCAEFANMNCKRAFECFTPDERASAQFIASFGASEMECRGKLKATFCSSLTDEKPCTDSTKKYSSEKANACINDVKNASCETVRLGTIPTGNCDQTCT